MNVGMVLEGTYPEDIRVTKEATALAADHEVSLLCLGERREREQVGPLTVHRVPWDEFLLPERAWNRATYLSRVYAPLWARELREFVAATDCDALHVHDLPLVKTGMRVAREARIPLVADLHENYPAAERQYRSEREAAGRLLATLKQPIRWLERAERRAMGADAVLTPVEEGREHYLRDCGAAPGVVHVVGNTVDRGAFDTDPDPVAIEGVPADAFVVGYVGSFGPHRGLETLVDAVPALRERAPNAHLVLVGGGSERYEAGLRERIRERGVEDCVTLTGWVEFEEVPGYMAACDVLAVPHRDTEHTRTTVPHKLFQYMALGVPVLVTDVGPLERIVRNADCGRVVADGNGAGAAAALADIASDPERARALGANGRRAVAERYNWAEDARTLRRVYERLA